MANFAYRSPSILNIDGNQNIKPEFTTDYELELGYKLGNLSLVLNGFDTRIKDAIVYDTVIDPPNFYFNSGKVGTQGLEAQLNFAEKWGSVKAAYSYYRTVENTVPQYMSYDVSGNEVTGINTGMPAHKITLAGSVKIADIITVSPSAFYLSERYNTYYSDAVGGDVYQKLGQVAVTNLVLSGEIIKNQLSLSLACYNVFDADYSVAPGYYDYDRETPGNSREYMAKLNYKF